MKLSNSFALILLSSVSIFSCVQNTEIRNVKDRRQILIDSLVLIKNSLSGDTNLHKIRVPSPIQDNMGYWPPLIVSCVMKNISNSELLISTGSGIKLLGISKNLQVSREKYLYFDFYGESIHGILDTLSSNAIKKYYSIYVFNNPKIEHGQTLYLEIVPKLYYPAPDTLKMHDSSLIIRPFRFDEKLVENNRFVIKIDLLESSVHLVDSTFEEILESYKRRNFVSQLAY